MPTSSEDTKQEPFDVPHHLIGAVPVYGGTTTTTPPPPVIFIGKSVVSPTYLNFAENLDLSNANVSRIITNYYGINDFSIFEPYIHYSSNSISAGSAMSDFGVANQYNALKINTMLFLQEASVRFEIYSRQYRTGTISPS